MIQDILTYLTILAALVTAVYRIVRFIVGTARGENPACSSCSLHHLHIPDARKDSLKPDKISIP